MLLCFGSKQLCIHIMHSIMKFKLATTMAELILFRNYVQQRMEICANYGGDLHKLRISFLPFSRWNAKSQKLLAVPFQFGGFEDLSWEIQRFKITEAQSWGLRFLETPELVYFSLPIEKCLDFRNSMFHLKSSELSGKTLQKRQ